MNHQGDAGISALIRWLAGEVDQVILSMDQATQVPNGVASGVCIVRGPKGRGGQIARGVERCEHELIWVLHADSSHLDHAVIYLRTLATRQVWGRFDVQLPGLNLVALMMNLRSRLTKVCTGDQGIFFTKSLLVGAGGFPQQPLMEDIELCRRLKRAAANAFVSPRITVMSSSRRWFAQGVVRTVLHMWWLRLRYFFGASSQSLYQDYYR
ncbi:MAG: glycosyl transferase [Pseudomonadota bacterium]